MSDPSPLVDLDDILVDGPISADAEGVDPERLAIRPPGPGLPESIGWMVLLFMAQIGAAIVVMSAYSAILVISGTSVQRLQSVVTSLDPNPMLWLFGGPNLLAFLLIIAIGLFRLRPGPFRQLNVSAPSGTQSLIFATVVLPLGLIADAMWQHGDSLWSKVVEQFPVLQLLDQSNVVAFMEQINGANLPSLLLLLAIVPAVGEEFVFRGLIGRGLVARWGVIAGVAMTSVMFACMHMYPPHVWAVLPIGLVMHVVYLTTRSFWAPVAFHFINNGLAAVYASYGLTGTEGGETLPDWLTVVAPFYVILCCALLWRYRTRYVDEEGCDVSPGYCSVAPPDAMGPTRRRTVRSIPVMIVMGLILSVQIGVVARDLIVESSSAAEAGELHDVDGVE